MPEQYFKYIFELLHQKDVKDYIGLVSPEEHTDLCYHLAGQLDHFQSSFSKAGEKFNTNIAIAAGKADDIDFTSYQKATITLPGDLACLVKAANGGAKINPSISIHPIAKPTTRPAKQQRPNYDNVYGGGREFENANGN